MRTTLAALVAVATTAALATVTSPAEATTGPVIVSPTQGSTVANGFDGPVTIGFADAPAGQYRVYVSCNDGAYLWEAYPTYAAGDPTETSFAIDPVTGPAACSYGVESWGGGAAGQDAGEFTVRAPALAMTNASISPNTIYTLVRDGYRDATTARYTLNVPAAVTALVTDSKGRTVKKSSFTQGSGRRSWSWTGHTGTGRLAPVGAYRLRITAKAAGVTRTFSERVYVKTALVTRSSSKRKDGDAARFATSGNCYASRDTYDGIGELDCWGGKYAMASYGFSVPASAYSVSWSMPGERTGADICCTGSITKSGTRTSRTSFRLRTKVTGWRAYDVWSARISYKYKKRI